MATLFLTPAGLTPATAALLAVILALSALMSGLSGFGFSAIGAICLWLLPPTMAVPLLMALSSANQLVSIRQLRRDLKPLGEWWPDGAAPYLLGGLLGVPVGVEVLHALPAAILMIVFGGFLVSFAAYSIFKPQRLAMAAGTGWWIAALIGMVGGIVGGFTAFPGAVVVIWCGLRHLSKSETRSIVQPYILGLQLISLAVMAVQHPETFGAPFWSLLAFALPVVLPCTLLGVTIYKLVSDINFRRIAFSLLGTSGIGIVVKGLGGIAVLSGLANVAASAH